MSADLAILVPVLGRPHRVAPLLDSIEASTPGARVQFLVDPDDQEEAEAIAGEMGVARNLCIGELFDFAPDPGYADKINRGVRTTTEPLLFLGADDLEFQSGWFEAAKAKMCEGVEVVGANDLIPRRRAGHATHFLVTREYAERGTIDGAPGLLHEGYDHSFVDDELIATAKQRDVYAYAAGARVKHLHWMSRTAPDDETYRKGRAQFEQDRKLFHERSPLWA